MNTGKSGTAALLAAGTSYPRYCDIGSGSGSFNISDSGLKAVYDQADYSSIDSSTAREVSWTYDFNSVEMSGNTLLEFGLTGTSGAGAGDTWNREAFSSITFDGTNELQIQVTYQIY